MLFYDIPYSGVCNILHNQHIFSFLYLLSVTTFNSVNTYDSTELHVCLMIFRVCTEVFFYSFQFYYIEPLATVTFKWFHDLSSSNSGLSKMLPITIKLSSRSHSPKGLTPKHLLSIEIHHAPRFIFQSTRQLYLFSLH